jgi:hypothetical protein
VTTPRPVAAPRSQPPLDARADRSGDDGATWTPAMVPIGCQSTSMCGQRCAAVPGGRVLARLGHTRAQGRRRVLRPADRLL